RALLRVMRGDVGPIVARLGRQITRAERHIHGIDPEGGRFVAREVAIVAGISLTMLGIKALKVLPSVPFAPGHKLVILTPLYVLATLFTRGRFGATTTGFAMGSVAFLMGDGRYGVFEVLKHVTPGIVCDLLIPVITAGGRRPGPLGWSLFGGVVALARFVTIFAVVFAVQAPAIAYAFLLPGVTVHVTFGLLSGYVTWHLVRAAERLRVELTTFDDDPTATPAPTPTPTEAAPAQEHE
ncbi:MAG: hypothetical protein JWM10_2138, partial [Myxococcaceae bacterium]|nr:hypothetical protein [Myxococcaceae bacterium]